MTNTMEMLLRNYGEAMQIVAFSGALIACGILELKLSRAGERGLVHAARRRARWPANFAITGTNLALMLTLPVSVLMAADFAADRGWGLIGAIDMPPAAAVGAGFLARSLIAWAVHLATHKVPVLWRLHRVHHSDVDLDVSTTLRLHPLEFAVTIPLHIAGTLIFGIPPVAIIAYEAIDAGQTVVTHADLKLPRWLERVVRWLVVTPDVHRMHHSAVKWETDSNYGTVLSVWDHVFGTYTMRDEHGLATMEIGLEELRDARANSYLWLIALPFRGSSLGSKASQDV
ncbi:MAG: sterol desaturase family protein [Alphaproteobacteria bacterium]|nr:sterol desaturase family protein [Alphaproteobacteria bacterium]